MGQFELFFLLFLFEVQYLPDLMHHERSEVSFQSDPFLEFVLLTEQFHRFSHKEFLVKFDPIDLFDLFSLYFHTMLFFENLFSKDPIQF